MPVQLFITHSHPIKGILSPYYISHIVLRTQNTKTNVESYEVRGSYGDTGRQGL